MSLFDSVLGTLGGKSEEGTGANPLIAIVGTLLAQSGGLQGLINKFSLAGMGQQASGWVSHGPNPPVSGGQVQQALGMEQIQALAAKFGIDPQQVSDVVAKHLPTVVDKLTPQGRIDPDVDAEQSLSALIPSLLQRFTQQSNA